MNTYADMHYNMHYNQQSLIVVNEYEWKRYN